MGKYIVIPGQFLCQVCKVEVKTLRCYGSDRLLTWMCPEKHLSEVNLQLKKSKEDYE